MRTISTILAGIAFLATVPAVAENATPKPSPRAAKAEVKLAKALEGRVAGKPVHCIQLRDIRSSTIYDGTAILYDTGSTLYLNRPPVGASSLDDDDVLVLKTSMTQVCSLDTLHLLDRSTHFQTGFVGLGEFVPYTKVKVAQAD